MQLEVWKNIKGYQGLYQASNLGNIKSLIDEFSKNRQLILKKRITSKKQKNRLYNRQIVNLYKNKKMKTFYVHKLVWQTFNGKIPNGMQVDHINNNPQDNRLQNLQLLTPSQNNLKRYIDNPYLKNNGGVNPTKIMCIETKELFQSQHQAARRLNLSCGNINSVLKGKYKHTGGYSFVYVDDNTEDKQQQNNIG